jgi:hypothetical protein
MTAAPSPDTSVLPPWGRFLLRLAAIALPFLTLLHIATIGSSRLAQNHSCARADLEVLLLLLTVPGVIAFVCAANMVGHRQRIAIAISIAIAATWITAAVIARWVLPESSCVLF